MSITILAILLAWALLSRAHWIREAYRFRELGMQNHSDCVWWKRQALAAEQKLDELSK